MADLRVSSADNFVGANHPTTTDTLNRLTLQEHDSSGVHASTSFPSFSVHMNGTDFVTSTDASTTLPFSAAGIRFDTNSALDSTLWCYNTPKAGKYLINLTVSATGISTNATNAVYLALKTTVGIICQGGRINDNQSTSRKTIGLSAIVNLATTDKLFPMILGSTAALTVSGILVYTAWTGAYLGK